MIDPNITERELRIGTIEVLLDEIRPTLKAWTEFTKEHRAYAKSKKSVDYIPNLVEILEELTESIETAKSDIQVILDEMKEDRI